MSDEQARKLEANKYRPNVPIDPEGPMISSFVNSLHREVRTGYEAGWTACLHGPAVTALYRAARKYLNQAPVDGWHFSDCSMTEDEEARCSCGVGVAEDALREALKEFNKARGAE